MHYAALEYRDRVDPEMVMPSVNWKTGEAKQRIDEAPAEPSKI